MKDWKAQPALDKPVWWEKVKIPRATCGFAPGLLFLCCFSDRRMAYWSTTLLLVSSGRARTSAHKRLASPALFDPMQVAASSARNAQFRSDCWARWLLDKRSGIQSRENSFLPWSQPAFCSEYLKADRVMPSLRAITTMTQMGSSWTEALLSEAKCALFTLLLWALESLVLSQNAKKGKNQSNLFMNRIINTGKTDYGWKLSRPM